MSAHDMPAEPDAGEVEGIKKRLTKALHAERTASNTLHADCWACEAVQSSAIYVEVWDSYHLGRAHVLEEIRGKVERHVDTELAALLARVRRDGEADGLRAAADEWPTRYGDNRLPADTWLRDRADRITP